MQSDISERIWSCLKEVADPEIPVLNVVEMGIVRSVESDGKTWIVKITPTYSGCPAMGAIVTEIQNKLLQAGTGDFKVQTDYAEVWTSDWMTEGARQKLKEYGIAPPGKIADDLSTEGPHLLKITPCPYCDSFETELRSEFGSTACKSQHYCNQCDQPFEHFKCI